MQNYLTLGQVIDTLQIGEVAVKVSGERGKASLPNHRYLADGVRFERYDYNTYILKAISGKGLKLAKTVNEDAEDDKFIIMSEEDYREMILNNKSNSLLMKGDMND